MRRVLIVAYFFPPLGGGGVQRTLNYVAHLPREGWIPVVIAPRDPDYEPRDPALVARIPPDAEVHRSFCWEPSRVYRWLVGLARYRPSARFMPDAPGVADLAKSRAGGAPGRGEGSGGSALSRWARLSRILFFPDQQIGWLPFALRSALRAHRLVPVQALYSSSSPITAHIVAGMLRARTGLPWVADFRDPWIGNAFVPPLPRAHRWLQSRVERWIVSRADRVVFATPSLTRMYAARYPHRATRFVTITNGYDRNDVPKPSPHAATDERFRLVYLGSLYGKSELAIFLAGVTRFVDRQPRVRSQLEIEFVGWLNGHNQAIADWYAAPERLGQMIQTLGFLPRSEALLRVAAADGALLLIADDPGKDIVATGKLYEYLGLDKPVLAMVPEGDARSILRELDWGVIADPDPDSVAAALERFVSAPVATRRADPEGRYDRARLAASLAGLLDEVAGEGRQTTEPQ